MFIGFLWYGLFFNAQWSAAVGLTGPGLITPGEAVYKHGEAVTIDPVTPMIINTLVLLFLAYLMHWLTTKTGSLTYASGAFTGFVVGTFVMAMSVMGNLFAMEPSVLNLVDGSYYLVLFTVMGAITGGWRKK